MQQELRYQFIGTAEHHYNTLQDLATKFQERGTVQDASRPVRPSDLSNFISFHLLYICIFTYVTLDLSNNVHTVLNCNNHEVVIYMVW